MLRTETHKTDDGASFQIRELSLYRVMQYQKQVKAAGDDEDQIFDLTSDMIRRAVVNEDDSPRWTEESFKDEVSPRLAAWVQEKISEFSGMTQSTDEMIENEAKNSNPTTV